MSTDRYLVTGGSGFIGTNLMEFLLQRGEAVLNIDIKSPLPPSHRAFWKKCDILDDVSGNAIMTPSGK